MCVTLENSSSGQGNPLYMTSGLTNWTSKSEINVILSRERSVVFPLVSADEVQQALMTLMNSVMLAWTMSFGRISDTLALLLPTPTIPPLKIDEWRVNGIVLL